MATAFHSGPFAIGDDIHRVPTITRRAAEPSQHHLDRLVDEIRAQLLLPIRVEMMRRADETARNVAMAHGEVMR